MQRLVDSGKRTGEEHEEEPGESPSDGLGLPGSAAGQEDQTRRTAVALRPLCLELSNQGGLDAPETIFLRPLTHRATSCVHSRFRVVLPSQQMDFMTPHLGSGLRDTSLNGNPEFSTY